MYRRTTHGITITYCISIDIKAIFELSNFKELAEDRFFSDFFWHASCPISIFILNCQRNHTLIFALAIMQTKLADCK